MFQNLQQWQSIWLIFLLIIWAVALFGGFIFGSESETHRTPTRNRMLSSFALVVAGWSWVGFIDGEIRPFAIAIALGMTFGFGGDLALSGWFGRSVLRGIALFAVCHICYIVGMVWLMQWAGLTNGGIAPLAIWLLIGLVGWYVVVFRGQKPTVLHWAALPYALLLAGTAGVATTLAVQSASFLWLAIGAALFLFSDLVLAGELFAGYKFRSVGDVIWLTYGPGQMLIVYSVGSAILI